ncbi:hypothetical protein ACFXEL_27250 [Streptomyces sp. NPDC059382]
MIGAVSPPTPAAPAAYRDEPAVPLVAVVAGGSGVTSPLGPR